METLIWILTAIGLGAGLAMDSCAVSMSNGLAEPKMKLGKIFTMLLPFIIIGCIAYIIYSGKNKIRDKKEQNIAKNMSDEERMKREEFLRNL